MWGGGAERYTVRGSNTVNGCFVLSISTTFNHIFSIHSGFFFLNNIQISLYGAYMGSIKIQGHIKEFSEGVPRILHQKSFKIY